MGMFEADAQALYEAQPADVRAVADLVRIIEDGDTLIAFLAVNEAYAPPQRAEESRGVVYRDESGTEHHPREYRQGIRAVGLRLRMRLLVDDTLQAWVKREAKARGGNGPLARALLGRVDATSKDKDYKAQIRKVQEWEQAKYKRATGANAERVARLRGAPMRAANDLLEAATCLVGVTGRWALSQDRTYTRLDARDQAPASEVAADSRKERRHYQAQQDAQGVLLGELDWVDTVEAAGAAVYRIMPELLTLNALHAEVTR